MFVTTVFIMILVGPAPPDFLMSFMSGMVEGIWIQRENDLVWVKVLEKILSD